MVSVPPLSQARLWRLQADGRLLHGVLDAHIVRHFFWRDRLPETREDFGNAPPPVFHMTIREGKIGPLAVPVGGHIKPPVLPLLMRGRILWRHPEGGVKLRFRQFIHEHEQLARAGRLDLRQPGEGGQVCGLKEIFQIRVIAVHRLAHVVAALAELRQRLTVGGLHRSRVCRAMVDGYGTVVGEERAALDVGGGGVCLRTVRTPGITGGDVAPVRRAVRRDHGTVRRQEVVIVPGVEMSAEGQLPLVIEALGAVRFGFGFGHRR